MSEWTIHEQIAFVLFVFGLGILFGYCICEIKRLK